jgi:hypothetical protein
MSTNAKQEGPQVTPEPAVGFHAKLDGASLWDLVQMECLARSHLAVEITGEGGVGYLYFDGGRVVHAATNRQRGEAAAMEILGWTHGTFQASNRSWPSGGPTIHCSHESLLLNAAKARDEGGRASNLVAFPGRGIEATIEEALDEAVELMEIDEGSQLDDDDVTRPGGQVPGLVAGEKKMRNADIDKPPVPVSASGSGRHDTTADFPIMVRLSSAGTVIRNKGGTEELAEAASYAHRLAQLTGELLGFEEFVALECISSEGRYLLFTEGEGEVVLLRPRADLNLQALRDRLGL